MSPSLATSESLKVQVSKIIRAKRQRVYDAWTKPEMIQQWFGPKRMRISSARADLRVGGAYHVEMQGAGPCSEESAGPNDAAATGVYQRIVPNELLCFTWRGTWDQGDDTLVTVLFRDVEGGTEVTLIHEKFTAPESMGGYEQGWVESLDKLADFCEG